MRKSLSKVYFGILLLTFVLLPYTLFAASFSALETQANVAAVSVPSIALTGGQNNVTAHTEINIVGLSVGNSNVTVGDCVITFPDLDFPQPNDFDCSDNVAVTDEGSSGLDDILNITQSGKHITLTTDGIFNMSLTSGTLSEDSVDGFINFVDGTGGTLTVASQTAGVTTAAHVTIVITDALPANAADQSVNIDGLGAIALGSSAQTAAQVAAKIRTGITSAGGYGAKNYIVGGSGANIIFEREVGGPNGNGSITITDGSYGSLAQVVTFTPTDLAENFDYVFTITINGTSYTYSTSNADVKAAVEALQPLVDANAAVVCTEDDVKVTCTAATPGTSFTYSASVDETAIAQEDGSRRHSSRIVTSESSSETNFVSNTISRIQEQVRQLQDAVLRLTAAENQNGYFGRNLKFGSVGEDVKRLQVFLNTHGFVLTTSGKGSSGKETSHFGTLTKKAVIKFQTVHGITPSGIFGPKTRTKVNSLLGI